MSGAGFGAFRVLKPEPPPPGSATPAAAKGPARRKSREKKARRPEKHKKNKKRRRSASSSSSASSASSSSAEERIRKKAKRKKQALSDPSSSSDAASDSGSADSPRRAPAVAPHPTDPGPTRGAGNAWLTGGDADFLSLLGRSSKDGATLRQEAKPVAPKAAPRELNPYWALNDTGLPAAPTPTDADGAHRRPGEARADGQGRSQFEYMGKWQPTPAEEPAPRRPGERRPKPKKETVVYAEEEGNYRVEDIERDKALEARQSKLIDYKRMNAQRLKQDCWFCLDSVKADKRFVVAMGNRVYLALPARGSLCDGHCLIIPMDHRVSARDFDPEELAEVRNFKKSLLRMFDAQNLSPIFMETVVRLKQHRHTYLECVPVPGGDAEMYFYNELDRVESEFKASSKRVIRTKGKALPAVMPEGFAYFHVEFGLDGGLLHLIEDEENWNPGFGRDVAGGLLESDVFGRVRRGTTDDALKRMKPFLEAFQPVDWTAALEGGGY